MLILSSDAACDICLDPFEADGGKCPASLLCGHAFCRSCLYTLHSRVCPVCRQPFNVTNDMRKLHVDFESTASREGTAHELRTLEVSRSGDIDQMRRHVAELESWLSTRPPNSRSSLSTVVQLMHLLMEATDQLNGALERAQADEKISRQQSERDAVQWSKEKQRLQTEIEAYKHAIGRQRDRIVELESQLGNPPDRRAALRGPDLTIPNTAAAAPVPLPVPSPITAPTPPTSSGLQPPRPQYASSPLSSPVSPATRPSRMLPSPNISTPRSKLPEIPVGQAKSLSQHESSTQYPRDVRSTSPSGRLRINGAVQGPRDRALLTKRPSLNHGRPPGAAPSAFLSESKQTSSSSSTAHEFSPYSLPEVSAATLPRHHIPSSFGDTTVNNNIIGSRRTSMPHFSYSSTEEGESSSTQPSAWRYEPKDMQGYGGRRPSHPNFPSADYTEFVLSQYTSPSSTYSQSQQTHPYAQTTRDRPITPDTPTLSRKRALRRASNQPPTGVLGLSQH